MLFARLFLPLAMFMSETGGDAGDGGGGGGGSGAGAGGDDKLAELQAKYDEVNRKLAERDAADQRTQAEKAAAAADELKAKGEHKALADKLEKDLAAERAEKEGLKAKLAEYDPDVKWAQAERKRQEDDLKKRFEKVPADKRKALGASPSVDAMKSFLLGFEAVGGASGGGKTPPTGTGPGASESPGGDYASMTPEQRKELRKKAKTTGAPRSSVPWG